MVIDRAVPGEEEQRRLTELAGLFILARFGNEGISDALAAGTLEEVELEDARLVISTGPELSLFLLYDPQKARLGKVRAMVDFLTEALTSPSIV